MCLVMGNGLPQSPPCKTRISALLVERARLILILATGGVLLAGGLYALVLGNHLRFLPDEAEYLQLATHLAEGRGYSLDGQSPTAFRAPGYAVFLSIFVALGARVIHLRLVNVLALALSLPLVFTLLRRHGDPPAAAVGVLLVLAYPVLLFTAGTLYPQTLAALLFLFCLALLTTSSFGLRQALLAGLVLGSLILTVPIFIITLPVMLVWKVRADPGRFIRPALALLAMTLACLTLWSTRNLAALGAVVPLTTSVGVNLLYGNSETATPNGGTTVDISSYEEAAQYLEEVEQDRFYRDATMAYVQDHLPRTAGLYALKVLNYFNFRNRLETDAEASLLRDVAMLLTYGTLLSLGLFRLAQQSTYPLAGFEKLLLGLYVLSALAYGVFFPRIRFRLPFDYLLIMLVALFLGQALHSASGTNPDLTAS